LACVIELCHQVYLCRVLKVVTTISSSSISCIISMWYHLSLSLLLFIIHIIITLCYHFSLYQLHSQTLDALIQCDHQISDKDHTKIPKVEQPFLFKTLRTQGKATWWLDRYRMIWGVRRVSPYLWRWVSTCCPVKLTHHHSSLIGAPFGESRLMVWIDRCIECQ